MSKGFFLGKFLPPHNGHLFVCDVARQYVDDLTVFVCSRDTEPIDGHLRAHWMRESLSRYGCNVVHMHRSIPQEPKDHPNFWQIWKDAIFEHHPEPIDIVFGSENYVYELANVLNAKPFVVDVGRQIVPVSGSRIRENPRANWNFIPPIARTYFQKKVTLIGPESAGKTTLTSLLASDFETCAIPEYGRDYDAVFKQGSNWNEEDFLMIAKGQLALSKAIASRANYIVFEDTDLLQTVVWSEALLGQVPKALVDKLGDYSPSDLYLLLSPEMEWVNDGTRYHSSFEVRQWFRSRLEYWLNSTGAKWKEVSGATWDDRHRGARQAVSSAAGIC